MFKNIQFAQMNLNFSQMIKTKELTIPTTNKQIITNQILKI